MRLYLEKCFQKQFNFVTVWECRWCYVLIHDVTLWHPDNHNIHQNFQEKSTVGVGPRTARPRERPTKRATVVTDDVLATSWNVRHFRWKESRKRRSTLRRWWRERQTINTPVTFTSQFSWNFKHFARQSQAMIAWPSDARFPSDFLIVRQCLQGCCVCSFHLGFAAST